MRQDQAHSSNASFHQVQAIKADDPGVLKALYVDNYPKIEKFVLANNGSADEAKDLFQEAFLACWKNIQLDKFIPENDTALAGYLYRIARNKWMDHLRSAHYLRTVPLIEEKAGDLKEPEQDPQQDAYIEAVKSNFSRLGGSCQEVLTRFYYKKQSMSMIAAAFNWTEATARNNKYRCLQKLREFLKK